MTPWERAELEAREYRDKKSADSTEGARILGWFGLILVLIAMVLLVSAGCASPDPNRIVQPVTWHELSAQELHQMCRDWSEGLRGCIVSRAEGDSVYTLPVVRP